VSLTGEPRPDRIIEVDPTTPLARADVVERLRTLVAAWV